MKKKLVIIDQSFKDYTGHHYNYNKYLYENFKKIYNISFYVNKNIRNEINELFDKNLFKIFQETSYSTNYKLIFLKKIKKINILRSLFFYLIKFDFIFEFISKLYYRKIIVSNFYKKLSFLYKKNQNCIFFFIRYLKVSF